MPLDPRRVKVLFQAALDLTDPATRAAFLDRECAADAELRRRVDDLLRDAERPSPLLEGPLAAAATRADFVLGSAPAGAPAATIGLSDHGGPLDATGVDPAGGTVGFSDVGGTRPAPQPAEAVIGTVVAGRYKVRQAIGEGGMGTVYFAEQIQPVRRQVALKLIRAGMDSRTVLARFDSERQALALMDHPNIARVLDAGTTESGHPFFVMELVKGIPLTDFCDQHRLDLPTRLNLFRQICSAVQHAHQKGIIHRDLKPTNILVEDHAGTPVPKVIDFGLAKATSGLSLTEASLFTAFGTIAGTPLYMAPEQATFNSLDVDTRADIYSLGVILYELLTGSTPIRKESLQKAALDEVMRVIREEEAQVPSHRISTSAALPSVAATRQVEPIRLGRFVRGDLDWIVMKALAKERSRRYDSAIGLANDVERFLNDEPVLAGPPTARYRTAKFIRRHRGQVVAASLIVLALIGGVVGTTVGLFEARRQEQVARHQEQEARRQEQKARQQEALATDRAEGERRAKLDAQEKKALAEANEKKAVAAAEGERTAKETAEAVLGFVQDKVFAAARPKGQDGGLGYDVKLTDAITSSLSAIGPSFAGKPLVEARLRMTIGRSYLYLDKRDLAAGQFAAARSLYDKTLGPDHPDTLASMYDLADIYRFMVGRSAESVKLREEVLALRKARLGPDHPDTLASMANLANVQSSRNPEAIKLLEEVLALRKARLGPDHPDTLASMANLATGIYYNGRCVEGVKLVEEVLALRKAKLGPDHPNTLSSMDGLARFYTSDGRPDDAVKLREEVLALRKAKLGPDDPNTLRSMLSLADSYGDSGRHAEALKLDEEVLALSKAKLGPDHAETLWVLKVLGWHHRDAGRYTEAIKYREEALARNKAQYGPDGLETLDSMGQLADSYIYIDQLDRAAALYEQSLAGMRAKWGQYDGYTLIHMRDLAGVYGDLGQRDKAIALYQDCIRATQRTSGPNLWLTALAQYCFGIRLIKWEKWAEAEPVLRASLATLEAQKPDVWSTFDTRSLLGGALLGLGRIDEARPLLISGYEGMKQRLDYIPAPDRVEPVAAADRLIRLAEATNRPEEAKLWREEKARLEAQLKTLYPAGTTPQAEDAKPTPGDVKSALPGEPKPTPTPPSAGGKP